MRNSKDDQWRRFNEPYQVFGPLMRIGDIAAESREAGFGYYDRNAQTALKQIADYAYSFLAQPHAELGRDGNVCPFVPTALEKGTFRATVANTSDIDSVEAAMTNILRVFLDMPPTSPDAGRVAEGEQIYKTILVGFPAVGPEAAPQIIDELQKRLKATYVRAGMMIGQFHPSCPGEGLHNKNFRPFQAPVACLAVRHITKYDAPFMDKDEYLDGYLKLFGLEGMRRIETLLARQQKRCPVQHLAN